MGDEDTAQTLLKTGGVVLRGVAVALDTEVGDAFVLDCARYTEGRKRFSDPTALTA